MNKPQALYIHIPFCQHLCPYCDFTKMLYHRQLVDDYLLILAQELDFYHPADLKTVFIGGGTPTALDEDQFAHLLDIVAPYVHGVKEYSIEANIENCTHTKLLLAKKHGVNRLSFGVQSFNREVLTRAGRKHDRALVEKVIADARAVGFHNISIDLIYGLPAQTLDIWALDVATALSLQIEHLSAYSLIVEPNTPFMQRGIKQIDEDVSRQYYDYLLNEARRHGYERYEISSFAKPGFESQHNRIYWRNQYYFAVGLGASGYLNSFRYINTRKIKDYLKGFFIASKEEIDLIQQEQEYLLLNLRLKEGFSLQEYQTLFGIDFLTRYQKSLNLLRPYQLYECKDERFYATDEGLIKLDYLLTHLV